MPNWLVITSVCIGLAGVIAALIALIWFAASTAVTLKTLAVV